MNGMGSLLINEKMQVALSKWDVISDIIGWTYTFVWSVSFYPQVFLNWQRKSVRGLSIDFLFYNVLGFFCYSIYNLEFYCNKEIRDEYHQRHPNSENNLVRLNDVAFSIHGFLISLFILLQTCVYKKYDNQIISTFAASFVWLVMLGAVLIISTIHYGGAVWLDFMYYLSTVKLIVSFIKYLPQVWLNYKRKSTQGWSIHFIYWDLSGGILSIVQLILDAFIDGDWSGIEGDNVKLGLGLIVILYDSIFLIQHYILYPRRQPNLQNDAEREHLISSSHTTYPNYFDDDNYETTDQDSIDEIEDDGSSFYVNKKYQHSHYGSTQV